MSMSVLQEPPFDAVLANAVIAFSLGYFVSIERNQIRFAEVHQIIFMFISISISIRYHLTLFALVFDTRTSFSFFSETIWIYAQHL